MVTARPKYQLLSVASVLLSALAAGPSFADPVKITAKNLSQFSQPDSTKRFVCRSQRKGAKLGKINRDQLEIGVRWNKIVTKEIQDQANTLTKQVNRMIKKGVSGSRLEKKQSRLTAISIKLSEIRSFEAQCRGEIVPPNGEEFSGNPESLAPYRNTLTENEVNHLLNKVAFGGSDELRQIGLTQGLDALVNAVVDGVMSDTERAQLETDAMYWAGREWYYQENHPEIGRIWTTNAARVGQYYRFIYTRDPFREWMLLALAGHFATNLDQINFSYSEFYHYGIELHWKLLKDQALGSFADLAHAMFSDPAMNFWLDNKDNRVGEPNQNYGRELMELFLLGAIDPLSGAVNYGEDSVVASTAFVSGFYEDSQTDPLTGQPVIKISYDADLHDPAPYSVFPGIDGAAGNISLLPDAFVDRILYSHPGSARYIAERFAGQMLYPGLPENIVADLANDLRSSSYQLKPFAKRVLKSSAMFSSASRNSCVSSPIEHFVKLARHTIGKLNLARDGEAGDISLYTIESIPEAAATAGQQLFEPPSVFGWKGSCNINRSGTIASGQGWIKAQQLLNRERGCMEIFDHLNWMGVDIVELFGLSGITDPAAMVTKVAKEISETALTPAQTQIFIYLLTHERYDAGGPTKEIKPNLDKEYYVRRKFPRIACMIDRLVEANLR